MWSILLFRTISIIFHISTRIHIYDAIKSNMDVQMHNTALSISKFSLWHMPQMWSLLAPEADKNKQETWQTELWYN